MRTQFSKIALVATLVLAMAFILSCSGDDAHLDSNSSGSMQSISSSIDIGSSSSVASNNPLAESSSSEEGVSPGSQCTETDNCCGGIPYSTSLYGCRNDAVLAKCGKDLYDPLEEFCTSSREIFSLCGGKQYDPPKEHCAYEGGREVVKGECGSVASLNYDTQFCYGGVPWELCGGRSYNPSTQFCFGSDVYDKCDGTMVFNPAIEQCCGNDKYTLATQFCQSWTNEVKSLCDAATYTVEQFCYDNSVYFRCNGETYNPSNQMCVNNVIKIKCGTNWYYPSTQFCHTDNTVHDKCGGTVVFNPAIEQCCGNDKYTLATQFCQIYTNIVKDLCGAATYTATQFCQSGTNKVKKLCGTATYASTEYCSNGTVKNYDGIIIDSRDGKKYNTTVIDDKTWMAENLNYKANGSKCGNFPSLSDENTATCDTYGRLYNWATAMALPSKCNSYPTSYDTDCAITTKHQGVCPLGWHLPSKNEWEALMTAAGGESTAGAKLKANSGWNNNGDKFNGTDAFGFSALPGGEGFLDDCFVSMENYFNDGGYGYWWNATEYEASGAHAYSRYMNYDESVGLLYSRKSCLLSVRCVQD